MLMTCDRAIWVDTTREEDARTRSNEVARARRIFPRVEIVGWDEKAAGNEQAADSKGIRKRSAWDRSPSRALRLPALTEQYYGPVPPTNALQAEWRRPDASEADR
jgi:hypothetical protein